MSQTTKKTLISTEKVSKVDISAYEQKARILGKLINKYPQYGSNSPELYLLAYLQDLGL
jgi:hypothetical protein